MSSGAEASRGQWLRARRPGEKAKRAAEILAAARSVLDEGGVAGATLSAIARRAAFSKPNCYRYFESREAILLAIAVEEAGAWGDLMRERLAPLAGTGDVTGVADVLARTTAEHPRLCMLLSALSIVLEHNVSVEAVADFKRAFNGHIFGTIDAFHAAIPALSLDQLETFLRLSGPFVAATWPNANPAPAVEEVLAREEFAPSRVELEPTLASHTRLLLLGLLAEGGIRDGD